MKSVFRMKLNFLVVLGTFASLVTFVATTFAQSTTKALNTNTDHVESEPTESSTLPVHIKDLNIPVEPFARNVAIAKWILKLDRKRISEWLEQSTEATWEVPQSTRDQIQSLLVRRLTASDPHAALEFAMARVEPVRSSLLNSVFIEWATSDLTLVIEHVKSLDLGAYKRLSLLENIFADSDELDTVDEQQILQDFRDKEDLVSYISDSEKREAVEDPEKEWYEVLEQVRTQPKKTYEDLVPIAQVWIDEAGVSVLSEMDDSVSNHGLRKLLFKEALTHLASSQPDQALDYVLNHDIPDRNQTLNEIVRVWAKYGDAIEALKTVHSLPRSEHRRTLENIIAMNWMGVDLSYRYSGTPNPTPLLDNLQQLPSSLRGDISAIAMKSLVWVESPTQAVEELLSLDDYLQLNATKVLVEEWARKDQESCIEWVLSNPQSTPWRNKLYHTLAWNLLDREEPELAFQIARKQPIPYHGNGLEGDILVDIASDDLTMAIQLLPDVRDGKTMTSAYSSVGEELFLSGKSDEAIELGTELPVEQRYRYYSRLTHVWAKTKPAGLVRAIEQFPSEAVRSYVALQQIRWNTSTNFFTTAQVQALERYLRLRERKILEEQR